jgi:hypothetical protein
MHAGGAGVNPASPGGTDLPLGPIIGKGSSGMVVAPAGLAQW